MPNKAGITDKTFSCFLMKLILGRIMKLRSVGDNLPIEQALRIASEPELKPGSKFQLTRLGNQRCPKLRGRTGTIVSMARTGNGFRVQFDGAKNPQSLHRTYIMPIDHDESRSLSASDTG
jgi:hypothetical protein